MRSHSRLKPHIQKAFIQCITAAVLLAPAACAFTQQTATGAGAHQSRFDSGIDVSLGVFGQLTATRTPTDSAPYFNGTAYNQTTQGTSPSAGVLGTVHQSFTRWLGYNVNFGYSRFSEQYSQGMYTPNPSDPSDPYSNFAYGSIGVNMYELTGAALVQGPRTRRVTTFFQLGGGALSFLPTQNPSPYWVAFRPAMVFGAGVNYTLSKHWALRGEYRGLFYKCPDWDGIRQANSNVPTVKLYTLTNEPTISLVYRFGRHK